MAHDNCRLRQLESRVSVLERTVNRLISTIEDNPHIRVELSLEEIQTDLNYGRGDYGQPMTPETEKGMGAAA